MFILLLLLVNNIFVHVQLCKCGIIYRFVCISNEGIEKGSVWNSLQEKYLQGKELVYKTTVFFSFVFLFRIFAAASYKLRHNIMFVCMCVCI